MTWTLAKIATVGVLAAMPVAAVSLSAHAESNHVVAQRPAPAEPSNDPSPTPPHGEYYNTNDANDWWVTGDAGGGGGG